MRELMFIWEHYIFPAILGACFVAMVYMIFTVMAQ